MSSKLTWHIIGSPSPHFDNLRQAGVKVVKLLDWESDGDIQYLRSFIPLVIYRKYTDASYNGITPDAFIASIPAKLFGLGLIFEGINEPIITTEEQAHALSQWNVRFANLMHQRGEKVTAYSFSTGNPPLGLVKYLADGARACDYIAMHEYFHLAHQYVMIGRYKEFLANLPADARRQVLITETGFDGGGGENDGWKASISQPAYFKVLTDIDAIYAPDDWCAGASIFQFGGGKPWQNFNSDVIAKPLSAYIAQQGAYLPTPPTTPLPPTTPVPTEPQITFTLTPTSIFPGGMGQLAWSVSGGKKVYLNGESVEATGRRTVNPITTTEYILKVDY